jgi:peptidoglycan/LPS O-acetylase OafA/YrhL
MNYRREIDGLRALAVLPVILFHAGFEAFSGGFVGVDVFFVISGYLITTIIQNDIEAGEFSLVRFYERRARRILPALFFVMIVCIPIAWLWLMPSDMKAFSESLIAVSLFTSNILFWSETGYFATAAEFKPLLHTWSLAVEEQYYVLFPLFMMITWRFGKKWVVGLLAAVAIISLGVAQWGALNNPSAAFFLLPTRGWELLIGAFIAFYFGQKHQSAGHVFQNNNINQSLSLAGLMLIGVAVFAFDKTTPFPSLYALIPTIGTALIILFAYPQTFVGQLLGNKVFVGIGLVSYSAYLWHQPLFAFARHESLSEPSASLLVSLAVVAFLLAYGSWRFVERPFRNRHSISSKKIFTFGLAGSILFLTVGVAGHKGAIKTNFEFNHPTLVNAMESGWRSDARQCTDFSVRVGSAHCRIIGSGDIKVVVWGDSHVYQLIKSMTEIAGVEFHVVDHNGCPPVVGVRRFDKVGNYSNCSDQAILTSYADYIKKLSPKVVILAARWSLYINGWQKRGVLQSAHHFLTDTNGDDKVFSESKNVLRNKLKETIDYFSPNSTVIIVSQPPDLNRVHFRRVQRTDLNVSKQSISDWHLGENQLLAEIAKTTDVKVIDSKEIFCSREICRTRKHGHLLYMDDNHLSKLGTNLLWDRIVQELVDDD